MAVEIGAARRRIIRRPRLTSILDDSSARIRLLIAPAGYGKTTLAREWLGDAERRDVWYRGGPASADVAALAAGIAEAASEIVPDAGRRMRDRLRATGHPEEDVDILAELFAEDVQGWPSDAWLSFDDYHFAMDSVASERFVDLLTQQTPMQMLITSRRRPSWATARRILYGEILEIDRRALAMEDAEAREVLGREDQAIDELLARARGWPAVLGLAALAPEFVLPTENIPTALHTYFAEEVFQAADSSIRLHLAILATAPLISDQLAAVVLGASRSRQVIEAGLRLGVMTKQDAGTVAMHPLLRDYLQAQLRTDLRMTHAERMGEHFLEQGQWDYAFEVARRASLPSLVERTIELGLDPMLSDGRLATVQRWIDFALGAHIQTPGVDLAEAELAFRRGEHERAHVLASQAAARLEEPDLAARAHVRAGHSALLASKEDEGLDHFRTAKTLARDWEGRREALVGLYFAASELDVADAADALAELEASVEHTPDGILRLEVLRLTRATRNGGVTEAIRAALPKLHLAERTVDPLGLTAFLHMLITCMNLGARYREAASVAERLRSVASQYRLDLPVVHADLNRAISQLGLRDFRAASAALDSVRQQLPPSGDAYLEAAVRAIGSRVLVARHRFDEAISLTDDEGEMISSPPVRAEYLSCRGIAFACVGEAERARSLIHRATAAFPSSLEAKVLSPCIEAIISLKARDAAGANVIQEAWGSAHKTGNFDSLVCAYRAEPRLLDALLGEGTRQTELAALLERANDDALARQLGISLKPFERSGEQLTAREEQVVQELEQGSSNREIAGRLFITEATVKAHLRHVYEKLGVRTRAELLAKRARRP
jgi:ATP/maltotriose-dependent transcriptional regulator MalT